MWRCVNDRVTGYCNGEPDWDKSAIAVDRTNKQGNITGQDFTSGHCKNDPKHCMKYRLLSEQIDLSKLPQPHLVEKMTPPEPKANKEKVVKEKPLQGSMF